MADRHPGFDRLLAVWNGETDVSTLDALVTTGYRGHIGSRGRDLTRVKVDIAAYRRAVPAVTFRIEHQFRDADYLATRLTAHAKDAASGTRLTACGLNISRWEGGLLAEEWAVWESLIVSPGSQDL